MCFLLAQEQPLLKTIQMQEESYPPGTTAIAQERELGRSLNKSWSLWLQLCIFLVFFSKLLWENSPFREVGKERIIVLIKTNTGCCKSNSPIAPKSKRSVIWIWLATVYIYLCIQFFFFSLNSCRMGLVTVCQGTFYGTRKTGFLG